MKLTSNRFLQMPVTVPGWRSVWFELVFVVTFTINILINLYVFRPNAGPLQPIYISFVLAMLACGLAGGVYGLIAVTKRRERSLLVWISILIGLFTLLIILNELVQGLQYLLTS